MSFFNILLYYYFSLKAILQSMAYNIPAKKISTQKFRDIKACASGKTRRIENVKFIVTNCEERFKLQVTTTCIRISEPVIRKCSVKNVFLKILQNSQKYAFGRVSF